MSPTETATLQVRATVRYLRRSPSKVRQVVDLVRGLPVEEAERVLQLSAKDAAGDVLKLLESAIANAEHNHALPVDELVVAKIWCDEGPTRKWGRARARGRYFRIRKRTSHVTIVLTRLSEDALEQKRRREESSGAARGTSARRRAERVRRSRAVAQGHDHDHDDDHDHGHDDDHDDATATEASVDDGLDADDASELETTDDGPDDSIDSTDDGPDDSADDGEERA
ncbi:MAG TPA: 50S ribosomal protein L22 [Acidimicrobiia bacterium]|nr:50S ribosomal protein L22 [Acidimicrobiia bacterium]